MLSRLRNNLSQLLANPVCGRAPLAFFAALIVFNLLSAPTVTTTLAATPREQTQSPAPKEDAQPVPLEPGKPLERELKGGDKHTYEIHAEAGQFLHAEAEQLGIDVALTLYAPDGKPIASMDSPNGNFGPEKISMITEASGIYTLEVSSGNKNVRSGRYRVTVEPTRVPNDQDRARITAERIFMEAAQLAAQGNASSLHSAIEKFTATLPLWHAAGDAYEEGLVQITIGESSYSLGEMQKALDSFTQALQLSQASGALDQEGEALDDAGDVYNTRGEKEKALDYYSRSLQLLRAVGDRVGEGVVLGNIGAVYAELGQEQKALDYLNQALQMKRATGDRLHEAATLHNIAGVYDVAGEDQKALDYYQQALALTRATGDKSGTAHMLQSIGLVHMLLGDENKALDYYAEALSLFRDVGDKQGEAIVLTHTGQTYVALAQSDKALEYLNRALPLLRSVGNRIEEAGALNSIGVVYAGLGEISKSLDYYNQALQLSRAVGDRQEQAVFLNNIGAAYAALGDKPNALGSYAQALILAHQVRMPLTEGAIDSRLMRFWRSEGRYETAIYFGKQAVNKVQEIRGNIRGLEKETQQAFLKSKGQPYRELADLLIIEGRLLEAQQVLDLLKDEEYFEFIRRDEKSAKSLTAPVILTKTEEAANREYEAEAARVTAVGNEWAALRTKRNRSPEEEKRFGELSGQLKAANEAWEKFLTGLYAELRQKKSTAEAREAETQVREKTSGMQNVVRQLNSQAGSSTVALYTLVGEDNYRIIVVTPAVMVAREYPIKAAELRKKVFAFRQALTDPKTDPVPKAQELYKILIGPVAADLAAANAETLMWSLDDALRYLPMAALHDGHSYLVEKYRNEVFTPENEASLVERPNVSAWRGLGMGVSKSYGDFSALPSVPEELHRVIRDATCCAGAGERAAPGEEGVVPGQTMLDESFTEENMKKALEENYPLVHIASHFDFEAGNETDSFLLLGGKDAKGERLTLAQIREDPRFNFADTQLLTLSACNTAVSGVAANGREVDGLAILAQQKGARAVVASLWGVYDSSTGLLMQAFYRNWTTNTGSPLSKAEALRRAQLSLLHSAPGQPASLKLPYSHPYYWAPFILIGNWQ
jgi:CHAT domain-containing protein/Tfp pilus assembly protein PilF